MSTLALGVAKRVAAVVAAAGLTALALSWLAGVPYLFTLIGFACLVLVGHLATIDEDLPGGWSNPDGDRPFPWLELALKALTVVVLVVVALTVPTCRHLGAS